MGKRQSSIAHLGVTRNGSGLRAEVFESPREGERAHGLAMGLDRLEEDCEARSGKGPGR